MKNEIGSGMNEKQKPLECVPVRCGIWMMLVGSAKNEAWRDVRELCECEEEAHITFMSLLPLSFF